MVDHVHIIFRESSSESGEGGMIRRGVIKRKSQKLFERDSIVDLGFQLRIGIDLEPLLEQKAFHQEKRWIGIVTFEALADRVVFQKHVFNSRPINSNVDQFHSFDGPVLFNRVEKRNIGEGKVGFHIFEAHDSSKLFDLKELCQKTRAMSSIIINNINILALRN